MTTIRDAEGRWTLPGAEGGELARVNDGQECGGVACLQSQRCDEPHGEAEAAGSREPPQRGLERGTLRLVSYRESHGRKVRFGLLSVATSDCGSCTTASVTLRSDHVQGVTVPRSPLAVAVEASAPPVTWEGS